MVKLYKLHKFFGLSAGLVILILGITGFFIDHDKWNFLYSTTFKYVPQTTLDAEKKLLEAYWVDPQNNNHIFVGGKRGIFESKDGAKSFVKVKDIQCLGIRSNAYGVFAATNDGVYRLENNLWNLYALAGEYITSLALHNEDIVVVLDKHEIVHLHEKEILKSTEVHISKEKLEHSINLSRFVRDLHYGRGIFDGDISLLINDYGALYGFLFAMSGYIIWWLVKRKKQPKLTRKLIRIHANWFAIIAIFPLLIVAITGIFLDHSKDLNRFMRSVTISEKILPPVYTSLKHDIWSVDYDGETYRIGNRHGIFQSHDLKNWDFEIKGLAYRMIRDDKNLYVSGMGAPNRIYTNEWKILPKTPHMFRDMIKRDERIGYFSTHGNLKEGLPKFENATLYSLLLTLHDGTFFASWWVWVNDYAALSLLLLFFTGSIRWYRKKNKA